jgi:hypothetical protein
LRISMSVSWWRVVGRAEEVDEEILDDHLVQRR